MLHKEVLENVLSAGTMEIQVGLLLFKNKIKTLIVIIYITFLFHNTQLWKYPSLVDFLWEPLQYFPEADGEQIASLQVLR